MNYFKKHKYDPYMHKGRMIEASKLAGLFDSKYYALIDGLVDFDIEPSKYHKVVMRRIWKSYNKYPFKV